MFLICFHFFVFLQYLANLQHFKKFWAFFFRNTYFLYPRSLVTFPTKSIWSLFCTLKTSLMCKPKGSGFIFVGLLHTGHPLYRGNKIILFAYLSSQTLFYKESDSVAATLINISTAFSNMLQLCLILQKNTKNENILRTY